MEDRIKARLHDIENDFRVKVIFACESGSRAWGFPSLDSDYDVRFVYYHPTEWYISLERERDVIELPISDSLDFHGWDIAKTLNLLRRSNPNILEWMNSPIVYKEMQGFNDVRSLADVAFNSRSSFMHYLSMATNNSRHHLEGAQVNIKKYLYTIRPIMCALWVDRFGSQPPMVYTDLLDAIVGDADVRNEVRELVRKKQSRAEADFSAQNSVLNSWISESLDYLKGHAPEGMTLPDLKQFDAAYLRIIGFHPK